MTSQNCSGLFLVSYAPQPIQKILWIFADPFSHNVAVRQIRWSLLSGIHVQYVCRQSIYPTYRKAVVWLSLLGNAHITKQHAHSRMPCVQDYNKCFIINTIWINLYSMSLILDNSAWVRKIVRRGQYYQSIFKPILTNTLKLCSAEAGIYQDHYANSRESETMILTLKN